MKKHKKILRNDEEFLNKIKKMLKNGEVICRIKQKSQSINNWTLKIKQRDSDDKVVDLEIEGNILSLLSSCIVGKDFDTYEKGSKFEMVDLFDAARFLVQQYYKTDEKYLCSRTKLEKLLAIANLVCMANKKILFKEEIRINECGVGIPELAPFAYSDIIDGEEVEKEIKKNEFVRNTYPTGYKLIEDFSTRYKDLLISVFCHFGAYPARDLGKIFDGFKFQVASEKNISGELVIDSKKFFEYINKEADNSNFNDNKIIEFVIKSEDI